MNNELILGVCDGEELSISHQEQLAHTFVFSGANQTNAFIFEVIVKKIESKEGIIFIQGEKTSLKDTFCEKVRNSVRRDEYIAIFLALSALRLISMGSLEPATETRMLF